MWSFRPVRGRVLWVALVDNPDQREYSRTKAFKTPNLREKHSPCLQGAQVWGKHSPALREPTVSSERQNQKFKSANYRGREKSQTVP